MFQMKFDTDNAAFHDESFAVTDDPTMAREVARILREVARRVEQGNVGNFRTIFDANGNDVGRWKLEGPRGVALYVEDDALTRR